MPGGRNPLRGCLPSPRPTQGSLVRLGNLGLKAVAPLGASGGVRRVLNCLFLPTDDLSFDPNRLKPRNNLPGRHLALIEVPPQAIEVPPQTIGMPSQAVGMAPQGVEVPAQAIEVPEQAVGVPLQPVGVVFQAIGMGWQGIVPPSQPIGVRLQAEEVRAQAIVVLSQAFRI
jgi:hypothetical protein